jgi:hypothetical protein
VSARAYNNAWRAPEVFHQQVKLGSSNVTVSSVVVSLYQAKNKTKQKKKQYKKYNTRYIIIL